MRYTIAALLICTAIPNWSQQRSSKQDVHYENRFQRKHQGLQLSDQLSANQPLAVDFWDTLFKHTGGYGGVLDNAFVEAIAIDGDNVYIAGSFEFFNENGRCYNIAHYKMSTNTWTRMGDGFNGNVFALAARFGKVYAGGTFNRIGFDKPDLLPYVAEWDGTKWEALGGGTNGAVYALAIGLDTEVYVGGYFSKAGSVDAQCLAIWLPDQTYQHGGYDFNESISIIKCYGDTTLVGGSFWDDAASMSGIAMLQNGTWSNLGNGINGTVYDIVKFNGKIYAGGDFNRSGLTNILSNIGAYNGVSWDPIEQGGSVGFDGPVYSMASITPSGKSPVLLIGGSFTKATNVSAHNIARLSENGVSNLGNGVYGVITAMASRDTFAYVGGNFSKAGATLEDYITLANETECVRYQWHAMPKLHGGYAATGITGIATTDDYVFIGGDFTKLDGEAFDHVAMYDKNERQWKQLGEGLDGEVWKLAVHGSKLYAGGEFKRAGDVLTRHIAMWDMNTKTWSAMGDGAAQFVDAIEADETGVYAAVFHPFETDRFNTYLGKWDGASWSRIDGAINGYVNAIERYEGALYVGGTIYFVDEIPVNNIFSITSTGWDVLGEGVNNRVNAIVAAPPLGIVAGGQFGYSGTTMVRGIAAWNGSDWISMAGGFNSYVRGLAFDGTSVFATGYFTLAATKAVRFLAQYDGQQWSELGGGLNYTGFALATDKNSLYVGGGFTTVGNDQVSYRFARYVYKELDVTDASNLFATLGQNVPNPAGQQTDIAYTVTASTRVLIELYDALGRKVRTVVNRFEPPGAYNVKVDVKTLPPGSYFYTLHTAEGSIIKGMQVIH